jgi:membrane protease YdiL (CAAX protease family)
MLASPGTSVIGKYALSWYAVAFVLLAVVARKHQLAASVVTVLGIAAGLFFSLRAAVAVVSNQDPSAWLYIVGGITAAGLSAYQLVRRRLDPVVLVAMQLGTGLVAYWAYNAVSGLGLNPSSYPPETLGSPFRVEVPLIALALAGVGFGIARDGQAARWRLGLTMPAWWHFFLALLVAYALIGLDGFANYLTYWIVPGGYEPVGAVLEIIDTGPVLAGLVYAGLAGIGEEVLFRGALQPRAGLVATAL